MTQEIKLKLEQATAHYDTSDYDACNHKIGFLAGAQTILENPQEWDLFTAEQIVEQRNLYRGQVDKIIAEYDDLKSQLAKYKEALERILQGNCSPTLVAKEALKQEVNNETNF